MAIRPDPFERRQVARWLLAVFEISILTGAAGFVGWFAAGTLGAAFAKAIGDDILGTSVTVLAWGFVGGGVGTYLSLRWLAR